MKTAEVISKIDYDSDRVKAVIAQFDDLSDSEKIESMMLLTRVWEVGAEIDVFLRKFKKS